MVRHKDVKLYNDIYFLITLLYIFVPPPLFEYFKKTVTITLTIRYRYVTSALPWPLSLFRVLKLKY